MTETRTDTASECPCPTGLAIDGAPPVRKTMLPYGRQQVDDEDIRAVVDVLRSDWLTTGPAVERFERAFAAKVGARHAIAVSSGTAALHAAAFAAGIGEGDEVIVPAMTFAASANCVRYLGGTVVFADVRPDTLALDVTAVERQITGRTKAVIPVDYAGQPADHDEVREIARANGLLVIEDACHSLGASYRGRTVGSIADMTVFSFHPVKHITTGEGGMVTCDDDERAQRLRSFRSHGISTDYRQRETQGSWFYEMTELGFNYRLTDLQCALGLSQLGKLSAWVGRRREIAARYLDALAGLEGLELPAVLPDRQPSWHLFVVQLRLDRLRVGRERVFRALRAENVGVNVHYVPVPRHPYYRNLGYEPGSWPAAEAAYERLLSIPIFPSMTDADVDDVVAALRKVLGAYAL